MPILFAKSTGGNWSAAGTWSITGSAGVDSSGPPTAADEVIFESGSGNVTINAAAVCRSIDCNGIGLGVGSYAGVLTHNAGITLSIGNSLPGTANIALRFVAGMTYTLGNATTSAISFVSTSLTQQTVDFAGKTTGNVTFNGVGGSWQLTSGHSAAATVNLTAGSLDINGQTCSWNAFNSSNSNVRSLTLGSASITLTGTSTVWTTLTSTNLTFNAGTSTITFNAATQAFSSGGLTFNNLVSTGSGNMTINSPGPVCANFTRTGTAVKADSLTLQDGFTVTGTLTLTGNSTINRLLVQSNTLGTARTITAASVSITNADFMDITGAGAASPFTGTSLGDALGNSGITFTPAATQTWSGTSGGNWSTNAWTTRVPLPQDDVVIASAFTAGQTVVADMPRMGRDINWTGATGSPTFNWNNTGTSFYGSLTLISGMSVTASNTNTRNFRGRGSHTITSAGKSLGSCALSAPSGTYTLLDAFSTAGSTCRFTLNAGTFNDNGFSVTLGTDIPSFIVSSNDVTLTASGTWTVTTTASGTFWSLSSGSAATYNTSGMTIVIANASANSRTFGGQSKSYGTLSVPTGGAGAIVITGSNTFNKLVTAGGSTATVNFTAGTTQTLTGGSDAFFSGTAGNLITVQSVTAGSQWTVSKSSGIVSSDHLSIQDSNATGGATFYAGANSVNAGNNVNWNFFAQTLIPLLMPSMRGNMNRLAGSFTN